MKVPWNRWGVWYPGSHLLEAHLCSQDSLGSLLWMPADNGTVTIHFSMDLGSSSPMAWDHRAHAQYVPYDRVAHGP